MASAHPSHAIESTRTQLNAIAARSAHWLRHASGTDEEAEAAASIYGQPLGGTTARTELERSLLSDEHPSRTREKEVSNVKHCSST
jgi:hypothetical protein